MGAAGVSIPLQLQAMISLATLPQKWEMLVPIITGDNELKSLTLDEVYTVVIIHFQSESVCHGSGKHNANKISAVKHKCSDLN